MLRLWDVASGVERLTIPAHPRRTLAVVYRPDGLELATAGGEGAVRLWDARDGHLHAELRGHEGAVRCLAYSPSGTELASSGDDGTVRIWQAATGVAETLLGGIRSRSTASPSPPMEDPGLRPVGPARRSLGPGRSTPALVLHGHLAAVRSVAFSPDGSTLITGGDECIVRIWRADDGREVTALNIHDDAVTAVAFAPSGDIFASGSHDRTAKVWDLVPGRQRPPSRGHSAKVTAAAFATDGSTFITSGRDGNIRLWDRDSGRVRANVPAPLPLPGPGPGRPLRCLALMRRGDLLAAGGTDGVIRIWDLDGGPRTGTLRPWGRGHGRCLCPRRPLSASASLDATVRLWDPATARCLATLRAHPGGADAVSFLPDGRILATAGEDRVVRIWEPAGGQQLAVLEGHRRGVLSLAFHPSGRTLATGSKDRNITLWTWPRPGSRPRSGAITTGSAPSSSRPTARPWRPRPATRAQRRRRGQALGRPDRSRPCHVSGSDRPHRLRRGWAGPSTGNHDETFNLLEVASEYPGP